MTYRITICNRKRPWSVVAGCLTSCCNSPFPTIILTAGKSLWVWGMDVITSVLNSKDDDFWVDL